MEKVYVLRVKSHHRGGIDFLSIICQGTGRKLKVLVTSYELPNMQIAANKLIENGYKIIGRCGDFLVIPGDRPLPRLASYNNFI